MMRDQNWASAAEDSSVLLWSFQPRDVIRRVLAGEIYRAPWPSLSNVWTDLYLWMAQHWVRSVAIIPEFVPIWCWHSCDGQWQTPPSVSTAISLFGCEAQTREHVVVELCVPSSLVLLSSYAAWNRFMDNAIIRGRVPNSEMRRRWVFAEPLFRHAGDDIQAVIPWIDSQWIRRVGELSIAARSLEEPALIDRLCWPSE